MNSFMAWLVAAYLFVVHFGHLFRIGSSEEFAVGASTILALGMILMGGLKQIGKVFQSPVLLLFFLLLCWSLLSSVMSTTSITRAYALLASYFLYLAIGAAVACYQYDERLLKRIMFWTALGLGISGSLTVIDYMGIVNVPGCNDERAAYKLEGEIGIDYVYQASGFYLRRSSMAAYYSLSMATLLVLSLKLNSWGLRLFYAAAAGAGCLAMLLTHNRSAILATGVALVAFLLLSRTLTFSNRVKAIMLGGVAVVAVLFVLLAYFPEHADVYKNKLLTLLPGSRKFASESLIKSDNVRIDCLVVALKEIAVNPFGHGFCRIPHPTLGLKDPHNMLTYWIWAGGVFTLFWLIPFAVYMYKLLLQKTEAPDDIEPYLDALRFGVIAFLVNSMAHQTFGAGNFWVVIGLIVSLQESAVTATNLAAWRRHQQVTGVRGLASSSGL